jgi:hypothetical protein
MPTQDNWFQCVKCFGLYFEGNPGSGACFARPLRDETSHVSEPTVMYILLIDEPSVPAGGQAGWRWCRKCEGLWFAGDLPEGELGGRCPTDPFVSEDPNFVGGHTQAGSGRYILLQDIRPSARQQSGWRWCRKCRGLWFGRGNAHGGACPADIWGRVSTLPATGSAPEEGHVDQGSGDYVLGRISVPG